MIRKSFFLTVLLAILLSSIDVWAATAPSVDAKYISFRSITTTSASIKWVKGSGGTGTYRSMVTIKAVSNNIVPEGSETAADINALTSTTPTLASGVDEDGGEIVYYGTANSITVSSLTAGTVYEVKIYSFNDDNTGSANDYATNAMMTFGSPSQNPRSFTTLDAAIGAPSSLALTSIATGGFAVSWSAGSNADGYITNLAETSDFTANGSYDGDCANYREADLGNTTSFEFDGLSTGTTYYWNLYAYNNGGNSSTVTYSSNNADGRVGTLSAQPTAASAVVVTTPAAPSNTSKLNVSWTAGTTNGIGTTLKYIVVAKATTADLTVTDGNVYAGVNSVFGTATDQGTGNKIVYEGTGTSVDVTNLTSDATLYQFAVYSYETNGKDNNGNFSDRNYAAAATGTRYTLAAEQTTGTAPTMSINALATTSYDIDAIAAGGATVATKGYLVVAVQGSTAPSFVPTDGTNYTANTDGQALNANAAVTGSEYVVYDGAGGAGLAFTITGLTANFNYKYKVYAYNWDNANTQTKNYLTASDVLSTNRYTLATEIATNPITGAVQNIATESTSTNDKSQVLTFALNGLTIADSLIIVMNTDNAFTDPTDGTSYSSFVGTSSSSTATVGTTAGTTVNTTGTGDYIVYNGPADITNLVVGGLANNTRYYYQVYQYAGGTGTGAENYYVTAPATANKHSLTATPTTAIGAISIATPTVSGTLVPTWTNTGSGAKTVVVVKAAASTLADPVDDNDVTANADFTLGTQLGTGNRVVSNDVAATVTQTVTGLAASTLYNFTAYTYDENTLTTDPNYKTTSPATTSKFSLAVPQVAAPTAFVDVTTPTPNFTALNPTSYTLRWTAAANVNTVGYIVVGIAGSDASTLTDPVLGEDNYTVTPSSSWATPGQYKAIAGSRILYDGAGTSVNITGLSPQTQYTFRIWSYNTNSPSGTSATNTDKNFNTTELETSRYTLSSDQTAQAGTTTIATPAVDATTTLTYSGAAATGATASLGYLSTVTIAAGTEELPADGRAYTPNLDFTAGSALSTLAKVVYFDNAATEPTTVAITNLTANFNYTIRTYSFRWDGTNAQTINYYTPLNTTASNASRYTLGALPVGQVTVSAIQNIATESTSNNDKSQALIITPLTISDSIIVVMNTDNVFTAPIDGNSYTQMLGTRASTTATVATTAGVTGTLTGTTDYVVYNGPADITGLVITGLANNTQYYYNIYHYTGNTGTGAENYLIVAPASTNKYTLTATTATSIGAITVANPTIAGTLIPTWTNTGSGAKTVVVVKANGTTLVDPVDDNTQSANAAFGSGGTETVTGNLNFAVSNAVAATVTATVSGLAPSTLYNFTAYTYGENTGPNPNYRTTSPATVSRWSIAATEPSQPTAIAYSSVLTTSMSIAIAGDAAKYIVVAIAGGTPVSTDPVDGIENYTGTANSTTSVDFTAVGNPTYGTGKVIYDGAAATLNITGLSTATQYSFAIWGYNGGTNSTSSTNNDRNYFATEQFGSKYTVSAAANMTTASVVTIATPAANTTGSLAVTFSDPVGNTAPNTLGYVMVAKAGASPTAPSNGVDYATGTTTVFSTTPTQTEALSKVLYSATETGANVVSSITGLGDEISYTFNVYGYNYNGTQADGTQNYFTSSLVGTATRFTLAAAPANPVGITETISGGLKALALDVSVSVKNLLTITKSSDTEDAAVDGVDAAASAVNSSPFDFSAGSFLKLTTTPTASSVTKVAAYLSGALDDYTLQLTGLQANTSYKGTLYQYNGTIGNNASNYSATPQSVTFYSLATAPTVQATNFAAGVTNNSLTTINLTWTAAAFTPADGATVKYLVAIKTGTSAPAGTPSNGIVYTADNSIDNNADLANDLGTDEAVVYAGTGTSVVVSGLAAGTQYSFIIYAYTEGTGSTTTAAYNTTSAPSVLGRWTVATALTDQTPNAPTFSDYLANGTGFRVTVAGAANNGAPDEAKYMVIAKAGASGISTNPNDGVQNTATAQATAVNGTSAYGSAEAYTTGAALEYVVYDNTIGYVDLTGLTPATQYNFNVFAHTSTNQTTATNNNYNFGPNIGTTQAYTLAIQPATAASAIVFDNVDVGTYRLNWTLGATVASAPGNVIGYVVVAKSGAVAGGTAPTDGTGYTAADADPDNTTSTLGDGEVVYNGASTNVTLTGLADNTRYTFKVYTYAWNGTNDETKNYDAGFSTSGTRLSIYSAPTTQATTTVVTRAETSIATTIDYPNTAAIPNYTVVSVVPFGTTVTDPTQGVYYPLTTQPIALSGGTLLGAATRLVRSGGTADAFATPLTVTGLTAATQYTFSTYAVKHDDVVNGNTYANASYKGTPNTTSPWTLSTEPQSPTAVTFATDIQGNTASNAGYTVSWSAPALGDAPDGYLVVARQHATVGSDFVPTDGTPITDPGNLAFGGNADAGTNAGQLIKVGSGTSVIVTGLDPETPYTFSVYSYRVAGGSNTTVNYNTTPATGSKYTLAAAGTAASAGNQTLTTTTSLTANWTNGTADRVLVFLRTGSNATITPTLTNGAAHAYPAASGVLNGTTSETAAGQLVYSGTGTSVALSSLSAGIVYSIMVVSVSDDGVVNAETNRFTSTGTTLVSYQFNVNSGAPEPTTISTIAFSGITTTAGTVTVTAGNGAKRLVSIKQAAAGIAHGSPSDVTTYSATEAGVATGDDLGTTTYVKAVGNTTSVSLSGLTAGTKYSVRSYEYNDLSTPGLENYLSTETYGTNVKELNTLMTAPTAQPTNISYSNAANTGATSSYDVSWTASAGGSEKYLVIRKEGGAPTFAPTNSTSYTLGQTVVDNVGDDETIVYVGALTTFNMTGMDAGDPNYFKIYAFNDNSNPGSENYYVTAATSNQKAVSVDPKTFNGGSDAITTVARTDQSIQISWSAAATGASPAPTGYMVIVTNNTAHAVYPADATNYTANTVFTSAGNIGNAAYKVIYRGTGTGVTMTGLTSGNTYIFRVYPYNDDAVSDATINYLSGAGVAGTDFLTATIKTLADKPTFAPITLAAGTRTTVAIPLTWNNQGGASNSLVVWDANGTFAEPVQGTAYVATNVIDLGSTVLAAVGSGTQSNANAGLDPDTRYYYRVYNYNTAGASTENYDGNQNGTIGTGDYAEANAWTLVNEPGAPGAPVASNVTGSSLDLTWTAATAGASPGGTVSYLVIAKAAGAPADLPVDGTTYTAADNDFSTAQVITTAGEQIIFRGTALTTSVTGLSGNTSYTFKVYALAVGSDATTVNYNTGSPTTVTQATLASPITTNASAIVYSSMLSAGTGMTVGWTAGAAPNTIRYLVVARAGADAATTAPTNGTDYSGVANATFATGGAILGNGYIVYDGTGTSVAVTALTPNNQYTYQVYAYNQGSSASTNNYTQVGGTVPSSNTYSLALPITGQAGAPTYTSKLADGTGLTVNWTTGAAPTSLRYLVVGRSGAVAATTAPTNGADYSAGANAAFGSAVALGNGFIVYDGTGTSVAVTGLTASTQYTFQVYAYNQGANGGTNNYTGVAVNSSTGATLAAVPTTAPTTVDIPVGRTISTMTVNYTAGNGTNILVVGSTSATPPTITNGTTYAAGNLNFSTPGSNFQTDYQVLYNGGTAASQAVTNLTTNTRYYFYIYGYNGASGFESYTSALTGNHYTLAAEPAVSNTIAQTSNAGGTIDLSFNTTVDAASTLVVRKTGSSPLAPTDGVVYADASTYDGGATTVVSNVAAGATDAKTLTVTGLTAGTAYTFDAFSYQGAAQTGTSDVVGGTNNYAGTATALTVMARAAQPTGTAGALVFTGVQSGQFTIDYSAVGTLAGANKYLVLISTAAITIPPVDGTTYAAGNTVFGTTTSGAFNGGTTSIIYNGTSTSNVTVTGLSTGASYFVAVFAYADATVATAENYQSTAVTATQGTLAAEPTGQIVFTTTSVTGTTASLEYTELVANGTGRVIFYRSGAVASTFVPVDGTVYVDGTTYGDGIAYNETAATTPATITGLSATTQYTFKAYEFNGASTTRNYLTTGAPTQQVTTGALPVPTSLQIFSGTASPYVTGTSYSLVIKILDQDGNVIAADNGQGTIAIAIGGTSTTLTTMATVAGTSTYNLSSFNFSTYNNALGGTGLTLTASCGTLTSVTNAGVTVVASAPTVQPVLSLFKAGTTCQITVTLGGSGTTANTGYAVIYKMGAVGAAAPNAGDFTTKGVIDGASPTPDAIAHVIGTPYLLYIGTVVNQNITNCTAGKYYKVAVVPYRGNASEAGSYNYETSQIANQSKSMKRGQTGGNTDPDYSEDGSGFDMSSILNNPVVDKIEFDLYNYTDAVYNVQVTNLNGDVVATGYNNALFLKGTHRISIPLSSNIAAGSYFITVNNGTDIQMGSFIVMP